MDLKSENILINHELKTIKLIDFGHAVYRNDELWRGGVKATSNPEKLISAEHDWNAYFSLIRALNPKLSRNSKVKLEQSYRLFLKNERRIDYQKTKLFFDDKTNTKYRIKLIAMIFIVAIFIVVMNQMYKTKKPEGFLKSTQPKFASTNFKSTFPIQSKKTIEAENHRGNKANLNQEALMNQVKRAIPAKDSLFLIKQASQIGPEFENRVKNTGHSLEKNRLLIELIDTYELKFKNYLLTRNYDSIQIITAKKVFDHQISISMMNYYHLLK
jgi:serine/threonine protein kinase